MKLVLLSGGSGKRLWPLSNSTRSKQFLKVLENEKKENISMVQRVYQQLKSVNLSDSLVISTVKNQVELLKNQIGDNVPIVVEPSPRDTFPAVALAASYLYSKQSINLDEIIGIMPSDTYVEESFFKKIISLEEVVKRENVDIGLIGAKPTFPTSKYGYIIPKNLNSDLISPVEAFKEKPTKAEAEDLMSKSALWNCGVLVFKLGYILSLLSKKGLPIEYDKLIDQFDSIPKVSFDYEVLEEANNIVVLPYHGSWKDIGTWNTLSEEMITNKIGKGRISADSINTHLINELDIPVTVIGVSNAIVAVGHDGILVSDKQKSPIVKDFLKDSNQRPMYEERRWGWYKVLDYKKNSDEKEVLTKRIFVNAGKNLSYQKHKFRDEVWTIVNGEGEFVLNGKIVKVKQGDVLLVSAGDKHGIKATTDLEFIEVQIGKTLIEEDIERIYMIWDEVLEECELAII